MRTELAESGDLLDLKRCIGCIRYFTLYVQSNKELPDPTSKARITIDLWVVAGVKSRISYEFYSNIELDGTEFKINENKFIEQKLNAAPNKKDVLRKIREAIGK